MNVNVVFQYSKHQKLWSEIINILENDKDLFTKYEYFHEIKEHVFRTLNHEYSDVCCYACMYAYDIVESNDHLCTRCPFDFEHGCKEGSLYCQIEQFYLNKDLNGCIQLSKQMREEFPKRNVVFC